MNDQLSRHTGISLNVGSILITVTMVLHPAGGGIEHLLQISTLLIVTHSLAIFSIPFLLFGFWGLTKKLNSDNAISMIAFITISMGVFAGMLAAAINGLALPIFLNQFADQSNMTLESIELILQYGLSLNRAMTYIFIGACCLSIILWGILIVRSSLFPKWSGYLGMLLSVSAITTGISGFVLTNLIGFRIFIFGLVLWILMIGYLLCRPGKVIRTGYP